MRLGNELVIIEMIVVVLIESIGSGGIVRGESYLQLSPERVAMQDASAQYVPHLRAT